jgi:hypothetical protein
MAITEAYSGTQAVDGTEWSCCTDTSYDSADLQTADGVYQMLFDLNDMGAGDQLQIRLYEKVLSGSTARAIDEIIITGVPSTPNLITPAVTLMHGWDVTLKALAGTITVDWSIRKAG